jgi:hypothetical protein
MLLGIGHRGTLGTDRSTDKVDRLPLTSQFLSVVLAKGLLEKVVTAE